MLSWQRDHDRAGSIVHGALLGPIEAVVVGLATVMLTAIPARPAVAQASPLQLFVNSYIDEWGKPPKADPNAPPSRWPTSQLPPQP